MSRWNDDTLSEPLREVLRCRDGEAYTRLVVTGSPDAPPDVHRQLAALRPGALFTTPPRSKEDADAVLAAVWLWHDFLDESHTISQGLHGATGSFWHAIMHRREGDFSNAKYWYARCRHHPALAEIATRAGAKWDPNAFVDLVERVYERPDDPEHARAVRLQQIEWETLFAHCIRAAQGQG